MIDFSNITLPFSAGELLTSGVGLLKVVGTFVLLVLAFKLAPQLIHLIRYATDYEYRDSAKGTPRDASGHRIHKINR